MEVAPLSVTLPLSVAPPGAAKSAAGTDQSSVIARQTRAGRGERKPRAWINPKIMFLRKLRNAAERSAKGRERICRANPVQIRFYVSGRGKNS